MKSTKQLQKIYEAAKVENPYITFETFQRAAKEYIKLLRSRKLVCSMNVSRSGMMRTFNYPGNLNLVFNVCHKRKVSYKPVKVGGCGMDMHWYLQFSTAETLCTKKQIDKWNLNSMASDGKIL